VPTYDYKCPECGEVREVKHHMGDMLTVVCECGNTMMRKYSKTAVIFNSPGFYSWDNKRKKMQAEVKPA